MVVNEGKAGYNGVNAEKVTERLVNFNPVVLDYEKASSLDIRKDLGDLARFTIFTVYVSDVSKVEQKLWNINGSDFQANLTNVSADRQGSNFTYEGGKIAIPALSTYTQTVSGNTPKLVI